MWRTNELVDRKESVYCDRMAIESAWSEAEVQDFTWMKVEVIIKDKKQSYAL